MILAGGKLFWQGVGKIILAGVKIILVGGKIISAGGKIILTVGEIILTGFDRKYKKKNQKSNLIHRFTNKKPQIWK